jgi:ribosome recycling factor
MNIEYLSTDSRKQLIRNLEQDHAELRQLLEKVKRKYVPFTYTDHKLRTALERDLKKAVDEIRDLYIEAVQYRIPS